MNVLYVATAYNRHAGDVITPWLGETIRRLQAQGVTVEVLAPAYRGLRGGVLDGVHVHRFRYAPRRWEDLTHDETAPDRVRRRPWYLGLVPGYALAGMRAARGLAQQHSYDVVHVHWPLPHALFGLAARRVSGAALVSTFHGVELTWTRRQLPFLLPFLRHVIRVSDAVTANSSYTAGLIRSVYERPVVRIPFGATVGGEHAAPDEGGPAWPASAGSQPGAAVGAAQPTGALREADEPAADTMSANDPRRTAGDFELLFAGRLVERKGVHHLLDALARVESSRSVRLRVVGDGPMRPVLEARASSLGLGARVRFDGFVAREALERGFAECDAFVLPAVVDAKGDTEGLGVVLVEASSYGKPVIASATGGIVDVVRDGETGILVPPGDAGALARAIEHVIERPERAAALGAAGRAHVAREFSWPAIIGELIHLYQAVSGHKGAR